MTDEPVIGLRRADDLVLRPEPGDELALVALIRDEIEATRPMTFARFMELALYQPDHGYYASGNRGPGRSADFLTAPESHPIFGWAVARQLDEIWQRLGRPPEFTVREYGAGTGALATGIVGGLARSDAGLRAAIRYRIAERAPDRERQVLTSLASVGAAEVFEPDDGRPIIGAILANEVMDALPVHRVVGAADGHIREVFVTLGSASNFDEVEGEPSTPRLAERLADDRVVLAPGQAAEICLQLDAWIAKAAAGLDRGLMILIDYGHPAAALYAPNRGSLLRAYTHHRVHDDPFRNVGRQDLTAHVDLTAVERAAVAGGLNHLGVTTQAEFLTGLGAGELLVGLQSEPSIDMGAYLEARSALFRLLDPSATGRFAVEVFGRSLPEGPPLRGLAFRMARG
ncbi:MAG: SAM-dependent methyltransferase [Chloroflexota bacterium]